MEVPLLENSFSDEWKRRIRSSGPYIVTAAFIVFYTALFCTIGWFAITAGKNKPIPEMYLNSLLVCPTIGESVIWDLKLDIINTRNDSEICTGGRYEVSIFPYNQTKLLTMAVVRPDMYIGPRNHTTEIGLVEASSSSIQDLNPTSGTIRLDLKIHSKRYDFVCGDAKVDLASSQHPWSSCGSMVGGPLACSHEPPPHTRWFTLLDFFMVLLVVVGLGHFIFGHLYLLRLIIQEESLSSGELVTN